MIEDGPALTTPPPARRAADIIVLGLWFGLATGLVEALLLAVEPFPITEANLASIHFVWTVPLSYALLFSALALPLAVLALWMPRMVSSSVAAGIMVFVGGVFLLTMTPQIHAYAKLALAAGVAFQAARVVGRKDSAVRLARRSLPVLVGAVALFGVAVSVVPRGVERWRSSQLPPGNRDAPNVVLLILDTVRAQSLGLYGRDRLTAPNLARLADVGVTFELPVAPAPWTLPTHATMFTGRDPHEHSADWIVPLDDRHPTLAEVFGRHGYRTGGFVANLYYVTRRNGVDRGFHHYEEHQLSPGQVVLDSSIGRRLQKSARFRRLIGSFDDWNRKTAADVNRELLAWIDQGPGQERPFLAFLNYFDAHEPYLPPERFRAMFGPDTGRRLEMIEHSGWLGTGVRQEKEAMTPVEVQSELNAYEAAIAYMDEQIGELLDELEARDILDETLFVVTSDHGEQFGEHERFDHGNSLYMQALHVPLVLSFPGRVPANRRVGAPVGLRELPATILELAGISDRDGIPGRSLSRYWTGSTSLVERPIISSLTLSENRGETLRSVVSDGYHYMESDDGAIGLYDLLKDREETHNLLGQEEFVGLLGTLQRELASLTGDSPR